MVASSWTTSAADIGSSKDKDLPFVFGGICQTGTMGCICTVAILTESESDCHSAMGAFMGC